MNSEVYEFCGCDVHKKQIEVAWVDLTGTKWHFASYVNTIKGNQQFWQECKQTRTQKVGMESTGIYWQGLYYSCPKEIGSIVFNSATIKLKTRSKADIKDAMWIVRCLRAGFLTPSQISTGKAQEIKDLCRLRATIVEEMTRYKNMIHRILDENQKSFTSFTSNMNNQLGLHALTVLAQRGTIEDLKKQATNNRLINAIKKHEVSLKDFLTSISSLFSAFSLELNLRALLDRSQACVQIESCLKKCV